MPDTQISEALGLIDGGLQLLLAAVHADDPKREMLIRVGDLLRDVRSLQSALSGHVVGWRTMDSAPKDRQIFVRRDNGCGTDYGVVWWGDEHRDGYPWRSEYNSYPDDRWDEWMDDPAPLEG